jgi:hypothetical protein
MNSTALFALIVLNVCHWAADFTHLSTDWMLNAKKYGKPLYPIFVHALVHAILFFQLTTHFFIDLLKGKINFLFRRLEDPTNKFHWWVFGADQFMHHLIVILTVYYCSIN